MDMKALEATLMTIVICMAIYIIGHSCTEALQWVVNKALDFVVGKLKKKGGS